MHCLVKHVGDDSNSVTSAPSILSTAGNIWRAVSVNLHKEHEVICIVVSTWYVRRCMGVGSTLLGLPKHSLGDWQLSTVMCGLTVIMLTILSHGIGQVGFLCWLWVIFQVSPLCLETTPFSAHAFPKFPFLYGQELCWTRVHFNELT